MQNKTSRHTEMHILHIKDTSHYKRLLTASVRRALVVDYHCTLISLSIDKVV